ncbi:MAG TPA: His-Xaa-Ser system protein HxsD [Gammaproteobacteria bacterium]|nr:His-Xaa-Ser system protein HxsD [Gammaproteobacteria bacterium]
MPEIIQIDKDLYHLDAIKKTIYRFADQFAATLELDANKNYVVRLDFAPDFDIDKKSSLLAAFHRELLDQDLRQRIFSETELTRNLILANAFSNAPIGTEE